MKRPARIPSQLPESLHKWLDAYALAASAAGVSLLAFAHPAEGKIIYTPADVNISPSNKPYLLDLNHDGTADFSLGAVTTTASGHTQGFVFATAKQSMNRVWDTGDRRLFAAALRPGIPVGPSGQYFRFTRGFMCTTHYGRPHGPWCHATTRYLGLSFMIEGQEHYGWARLKVISHFQEVLTGYAYETIPNKPIIAGKRHGKDEGTLGRLAQGASAK
jgi:hypothetical protein